MSNKVALLLICVFVAITSSQSVVNENEEAAIIISSIKSLRAATKILEDWYNASYSGVVPNSEIVDNTHFPTNLVNLAYWQAARLAPGFNENNVHGGEKEMIEIAKKMSHN